METLTPFLYLLVLMYSTQKSLLLMCLSQSLHTLRQDSRSVLASALSSTCSCTSWGKDRKGKDGEDIITSGDALLHRLSMLTFYEFQGQRKRQQMGSKRAMNYE